MRGFNFFGFMLFNKLIDFKTIKELENEGENNG